MNEIIKINENIYRLTIPYKDIYTTVYTVKTDAGVLLFDTATYDEDIVDYILPFLGELGVTSDNLKCVFISHNHGDHAGGLRELVKNFPEIRIISRSPELKEAFNGYDVFSPNDGDTVLEVLKVIAIPGHTKDSAAVYDTRTKTLITGDCLQLYGIYGSGNWGSNISLTAEHIAAIEKLRKMEIKHILTAHDYHPYGYSYEGDTISKALDACIAPLKEIEALIIANPDTDDKEISDIYNSSDKPVIGAHVVTGVRGTMA